jgi:hypothetical protein
VVRRLQIAGPFVLKEKFLCVRFNVLVFGEKAALPNSITILHRSGWVWGGLSPLREEVRAKRGRRWRLEGKKKDTERRILAEVGLG